MQKAINLLHLVYLYTWPKGNRLIQYFTDLCNDALSLHADPVNIKNPPVHKEHHLLYSIISCSTFGTDVSWTWHLIISSPPSPSYPFYRRTSPSTKPSLSTTSTTLPTTLSPSRPILSTLFGYHAQEIWYYSICLGTIMGMLLKWIPTFVVILQRWQCGNTFM